MTSVSSVVVTDLASPFEEYFQYLNIPSNICQSLQTTLSISDLSTLKLLCDTEQQILLIVKQMQTTLVMNTEVKNSFLTALNNIKDKTLEEIIAWIDIQRQLMIDKQHLISSLPSDTKLTNANQQRVLMKIADAENSLSTTTSDIVYILSNAWYYKWHVFTKYSLTDEIIKECELSIEDIFRASVSPRPPPIDNYCLQDSNNALALKPDLKTSDYISVNAKKWGMFYSWFGGGPIFQRFTDEENNVCLYPHFISTVECNDETGIPDEQTFKLREYPQDFTLSNVVKILTKEYFGFVDESTPLVHLWLPFECIRKIYPFKMRYFDVTMEEVLAAEKDIHQRFVEVPDDSLKLKLSDFDLSKHNIYKSVTQQRYIVHGYIRKWENEEMMNVSENQFKISCSSSIPWDVTQLIFYFYAVIGSAFIWIEKKGLDDGLWPRARTDENWNEFRIGDILDVKDKQNNFYEGVIRRVDEETHELCIHFMGWHTKWDDVVSYDLENGRVAKRHTHTTGPHRPKKRGNYSFRRY